MGVSGCGKSTIGIALARHLGIPFFDGDDFHPDANVAKMSRGIPLDDNDRKPWLEAINEFAKEKVTKTSLVIACSALKESYRKIISKEVNSQFVYLKGSKELIFSRMKSRENHFMPTALLDSQFATLEEPQNAIEVNIENEIEDLIVEIADKLP